MSKMIIIDVREKDEYKNEHIPNSINIPMSWFEKNAPKKLKEFKWKSIIILCQSWRRAKMIEKLVNLHCQCNTQVYEWWLIEWKNKWNKVNSQNKKIFIPIIGQVQIITWFLILLWSLLAYFININFIFLSGWIWLWLFIAWITWTCLLAELIKSLPYNK